jgi:hypothetical protein
MAMPPSRWRFLTAAFCILMAGCQYVYPFEVSGQVRSAATGSPLGGVKIYSTHVNPDAPVPGEDQPVAVTGEDGSFSFSEHVWDVNFRGDGQTTWVLVFSREGFKKEKVDLRRVHQPHSAKTTSTVVVIVSLNEEGR